MGDSGEAGGIGEAAAAESLAEVRRQIDRIDREIVRLLGERAGYVAQAAGFKRDEEGVRAPERRRRMMVERRGWAEAAGLSPEFVEELFGRVTEHFIARELAEWREGKPDG